MNRRRFTLTASCASAFPAWSDTASLPYSALGACTRIINAAAVKAAGGEYIEEAVRRLLVPDKSEAEWQKKLEEAKACPLPIEACNSFLPGTLRSTGSDANHEAVLEYAQTVFNRAQQAGVKIIVFGSSGSRKLKAGDTKEQAEKQFISLLKKMGPLAKANGITIAIEPLRRQECNFINTVIEGIGIVEQVNHPNIRMVGDIYHMLQNSERPDDLLKAEPWSIHVHIAEKEKRSAPGVMGDDFRPFFATLKKINYKGRISIEGKWKIEELPKAYEVISSQAREA
jgi:sugar phosphate isomerase/epimerase